MKLQGRTPLIHACRRGQKDIVRELLIRGADANIQDGKERRRNKV